MLLYMDTLPVARSLKLLSSLLAAMAVMLSTTTLGVTGIQIYLDHGLLTQFAPHSKASYLIPLISSVATHA